MCDELLPCPFCGGNANLHRYYGNQYSEAFVYCMDCKVGTTEFAGDDEAVGAWNRRAGEPFNGEVMLMGDRVYLAGQGYFVREENHG